MQKRHNILVLSTALCCAHWGNKKKIMELEEGKVTKQVCIRNGQKLCADTKFLYQNKNKNGLREEWGAERRQEKN